jgi:hypothetical protein
MKKILKAGLIYEIKSVVKKAKKLNEEDFLDLLLLGGILFMSLGFFNE